MPGYRCGIKERMLYSSCKSRLLDTVEQEFSLEITKKVNLCFLPCPLTLGQQVMPPSWTTERADTHLSAILWRTVKLLGVPKGTHLRVEQGNI